MSKRPKRSLKILDQSLSSENECQERQPKKEEEWLISPLPLDNRHLNKSPVQQHQTESNFNTNERMVEHIITPNDIQKSDAEIENVFKKDDREGNFPATFVDFHEMTSTFDEQNMKLAHYMENRFTQIALVMNAQTRTLKSIQASCSELSSQLAIMKADVDTVKEIVRTKDEINEMPCQPDCLPIQSTDDLLEFENISAAEYKSAVSYFQFLGGANVTEALNLMVTHSISDDFLWNCNWIGTEDTVALQTTRISKAFYAALRKNKLISQPVVLKDFQEGMTAAIRNGKQRKRNAMKKKSGTNRNESNKIRKMSEKDLQNFLDSE